MTYHARSKNPYDTKQWEQYRDEVKSRAYGHWDQIMQALAGQHLGLAMGKLGSHVPCPKHGGTDGFRLFKDFRFSGGAISNQDGAFSDGFKLLHWLYGWGFGDSIRAVGDALGIRHYKDTTNAPLTAAVQFVEPPKRKSMEEVARDDEEKARRMADAWQNSFSIMAPEAAPARLFLRNRGITNAMGPLEDLRFHPSLEYFEGKTKLGAYPVLLCLMRQPNGAPMTIQRIFLTEDGQKAPVEHPKKVMPYRSTSQYAGSAVRLDHNIGSVLCVTEGVETGLAWRAMSGLPTWPTCVAGLMEELVVPDSVKVLIVCGDKDRSLRGEEAASKLVIRAREAGKKAAPFLPPFEIPENHPKGIDWNDVLLRYGLENARNQHFVTGVRQQVAGLLDGLGLEWETARAHY